MSASTTSEDHVAPGAGAMDATTRQGYAEGARNCLEYLGVQAGEQVLLMPSFESFESDPETVRALREQGAAMGAHVSVAVIEALGTRGNPTAAITEAVRRSDVFIGIGDRTPNPITGHCKVALTSRWDQGARQVDLRGGKGVLATACSRYPVAILPAIARVVQKQLAGGGVLRITDDRGTDLHLPFEADEFFFGGSFDSDTFGAGQRCDWPLAQLMIHSGEAFSGVAMVDSLRRIPRVLNPPERFDIRNQHATMADSDVTRPIAAEMNKPENSALCTKIFIGLNPWGSIEEGLGRSNFGNMVQAAGLICLMIGDKAGFVSSNSTTGGYLHHPTIRLGDRTLSLEGRLAAMDDPHVRKVAERYGDPDLLLTRPD